METTLFTQLSIPEVRKLFRLELEAFSQKSEFLKTISPEPEKPINVAEAAAHVNLDNQTVYRLLRAGDFPGHKKLSRWYFFKSELNDWIKNKQS